jgi:3-hydroxyisobutyrate dehydrogenase-like beta-hydroxyacid dehydrogenase
VACHLQASGQPPLLLHNRTRSKAERLAAEPGSHYAVAAGAAELAARCHLVLLILADDSACVEVLEQMYGARAPQLPAGCRVVVNLSTCQPATTEALAAALAAAGVGYVCCPVFGR